MITALVKAVKELRAESKRLREYEAIANISDPRVREEVLSMMGR